MNDWGHEMLEEEVKKNDSFLEPAEVEYEYWKNHRLDYKALYQQSKTSAF